jgi:hypothetical protein
MQLISPLRENLALAHVTNLNRIVGMAFPSVIPAHHSGNEPQGKAAAPYPTRAPCLLNPSNHAAVIETRRRILHLIA